LKLYLYDKKVSVSVALESRQVALPPELML